MSQENVEIVRSIYEEWARGNFRAGADLYDPYVLFVIRPEFPEAGTYLGPDSLRDYTLGLLTAWKDFTITAEEFIEAESSVVVAVRQRGIGQESGTPAELPYFQVWTFRGRAVIRLESVREREEALEAVGLRE